MVFRHKMVILVVVSLTVAILALAACAQATPIAIDLSEISVNPGKTAIVNEEISLSINASGSNLQFKWTAEKGTISSPNKPSTIYIAPNTPGSDTITVEVISGEMSKFRSIAINVVAPTVAPTSTLTPTPTAASTETPTSTPTATVEPPTATSTSVPTLLPTDTPIPEPTRPPCAGTTSAALITQMWEAISQDNKAKALSCITEVQKWSDTAKEQQTAKQQAGCNDIPNPGDQDAAKDFLGKYWALNDVGLSLFMRGEILKEQGECSAAMDAYKTVTTQYSCAYTWNPQESLFWSVAEAAQAGLNKTCP